MNALAEHAGDTGFAKIPFRAIGLILAAALVVLPSGCQSGVQQTGSGSSGAPPAGQTQGSKPAEPVDSPNRTYHLKDLASVTLKANGHDIHAWVMDDEGKRSEGMTWLTAESVGDDDGMLFAVRDGTSKVPSMDNTILALDIIYISPQKKVLNVVDGVPYGGQPAPSNGVAMFVLEMKRGSAKRLGIGLGTPIEVPPGLERTNQLKDLPRVKLTANGHDIQAWVMDDDGKRREGMMWLATWDVGDNDGMIFAFPDSKPLSFWMHNTVLPLDIIYISPQKKVLNVEEGKPFDESPLPSQGDAICVLEMKQGSAKRLGIASGTVFTIPDGVKGQ
ncbi:MAG: DUF192 domain-containing protein [Fimbriimonadales bacterium]